MRKQKNLLAFPMAVFSCLFFFSGNGEGACRNPNLVLNTRPSLVPVAARGLTEIKWYGHAFFEITSSSGTRMVTDPFGRMGLPMPEIWPHIVTVGREHGNHNNVALANGNPLVLRGMKEGTFEWNEINVTFRDALVYNVPISTRGFPGYQGSMKGSAFVFEVDGMCICHSGDVSEPFNEDQLQLIGNVDILLLAIGGTYTAGPSEAKKIVDQLKPKIVVPMHYWYRTDILDRFTEGPHQTRTLQTNKFLVNKDTLPRVTEIYVLSMMREGEL